MKKPDTSTYDSQGADSTERLKQNLDRFGILFRKMLDEVEDYAILVLDNDGNILNWNKGAAKIKGFTKNDVIGHHFSIFYPADDRKSGLPDLLLEEARSNNRATHEGWRLKKDGSRFWGSVVITALRDENGNILGFSKLTRDLTAKISADEAQTKQA